VGEALGGATCTSCGPSPAAPRGCASTTWCGPSRTGRAGCRRSQGWSGRGSTSSCCWPSPPGRGRGGGRGLRIDPERGKADCLVLDALDQPAGQRPVVASELFGARVEDCQGLDVRDAAEEEKARWEECPVRATAGLEARWADGRDVRWGQLPDLRGYTPTARWHDDPATEGQEKALGRFGFEPLRQLTKGEADHLIRRCRALGRQYPTPATPAQRSALKRAGLWKEGMTKQEAGAALGSYFAPGR
jgi:hypothetical protein